MAGKETTKKKGELAESTLDHLLEGCQTIGSDYRYLYVNDVVARQSKTTKEELLGHTMMERYPGIEKTEMFARLRECIEKRVVHHMENEFTFPDGSKGWFELRMEPLPEGAFILSIDITDRKKAEIRMKELEKLKDTFIKIVSHQLRTPLSAMRWNLEEMLGGEMGQLTEGQEDSLRIVHNANIVVISRINDLLTAVDIEEGRIKLEKEEVQLDSLLRSVVDEMKGVFNAKKIICRADYPAQPLHLASVDLPSIRRVLSQLLDNAATYTKEGGEIRVALSGGDGSIRLEVADTGIGIPEFEQPHVFERFHRASNAFTMKPDGSGLGLYIAKYYIELHGGTLGFTSREGAGSAFWFELPIG